MTEIRTEGRVYEQKGVVYVKTDRPAVENLSNDVTVVWHDSRMRSLDQIRKAFALMNDIGNFQGQSAEDVYQEQRVRFSAQFMEELDGMFFHLSSASMSWASAFITFLVNLIIDNDIPVSKPLYEVAEDISKYVYGCLVNKRCCICQKPADLHHVDAIGMGFNRDTKPQIGARVLPLCRIHHQEWHSIGETEFNARYHIEPVRLDKRLAKVYDVKKKAQRPVEVRA